MGERPRRWTLADPTAWTTIGAVAATALSAVASARVPTLSLGERTWIVVGIALLAAGFVALQSFRRRRAIRRLEQGARRMLDPDAAFRRGSLQSAGTPAELLALAGAMEDLGRGIRHQSREAAKKGRNLEALLDAIDEPILATDDAERVLVCNRAAEALVDAPAGTLVGRSIRDLFTQARVLEMHAAARDGQTRRERLRLATPIGQRIFQVTATPLPAAWGEGVFGSVIALRDVTELAQAVQVKTDFVANASHELRTPVAAIRAAAETLESATDDPEMSGRLGGMIVSHAAKLEEMLRDLLDLSRLESPDVAVEIGPVSMADLERNVRALVEPICRARNVGLEFEIEPDAAEVRTDRKLLLLMIRNLAENAAKFAYEGTSVRVRASILRTSESEPALRVEVIDRGVGIPLQHQDRVFERYFQVDPGRPAGPYRGTGLGLAIVKHAAKALGGHAGLSSVWGRGTTAFVEVPLAPQTTPSTLTG